MTDVNIKINGVAMKVPEGSTILEAAHEHGIDIPTLCFMKDVNQMCIRDSPDSAGRGFLNRRRLPGPASFFAYEPAWPEGLSCDRAGGIGSGLGQLRPRIIAGGAQRFVRSGGQTPPIDRYVLSTNRGG